MGLPGPIYDALPDGWGMLLMDRLFKKNGLNPARIGPLERLTYINTHAMGALSFEPSASELALTENIPLIKLAQEVQVVLKGEGAEFLQHLLKWVDLHKVPSQKRSSIVILSPTNSQQLAHINMKLG
mgnify:CR=1 FL=1